MLPHPARYTHVHRVFRGVNPEMGCNSLIALPTKNPCVLYFQRYNRAELVHEYELLLLWRQHPKEKLWRQAVAAGYPASEAV